MDNFGIKRYIEQNSTLESLSNIIQVLKDRLKTEYKKSDEEAEKITEEMLNIHGLAPKNFDFISQMHSIVDFEESINEMSIDDNSNKNEKTVKGVVRESTAPIDKLIGYTFLHRKMEELYGTEEAKKLSGIMFDYTLGLSDSTNILVPYCWSLDASKIVILGKTFGSLWSSPPQRLDSYTSILNEVIHQISNHLAGAIAIGTFFLDIAHLMIYKEKRSLNEIKNNQTLKKYITNQYQKVIHGFNSLSRTGGQESPFTNISIFDQVKLKELISKDHYQWYFPKEDAEMSQKEWSSYVVQYIKELQYLYISFFNEGDQSKGGMPYRFPISTVNLAKKYIPEKEEYFVEDQEFLEKICSNDIYRYNIFVSEGTKIASCCRLISDSEMLSLASQSNSFGGGSSVSLGSHRVVTINFVRIALQCNSMDEVYVKLENMVENAAKILKAHKEIIFDMTKKQLNIFISQGFISMQRMFSTFGMIGIVECCEILLNKLPKDQTKEDICYSILKFFNDQVAKYSKEHSLNGNIEQIPAESYMIRLPKADRLIFGNKAARYPIYANQFISMWNKDKTPFERIEEDGKYNKLLTGGGIVHINIGENVTSAQSRKLIEYATQKSCEHFSITSTFCECEDGHVFLGDKSTCQICSKKVINKVARTVGFFTPVSDWKKTKRNFDHDVRTVYKKIVNK
ncbi:MAG: DUF3029 family protein [Alphaproteobacteria bacterium]|nr:DUF3029 family protein [Rickettsiales bacterium]